VTSLLLAALILAGSENNNTGMPLTDPLNWWVYMEETASGTAMPGILPLRRNPIRSEDTAALNPELENLLLRRSSFPLSTEGDEGPLNFSGTAAGQLLSHSGGTETRIGGTLRLFVLPLPNLYLDEQLSLWAGSDENPPDHFSPFHDGMEKGRHLYVDRGYLRWSIPAVSVSLGRIPQRWGPGRFTQLLLSDNSPPLDMLKVQFRLPSAGLEFTGFTATVDSDSGTYLTAHRLDITPFRQLRIGLSESILFKSAGLDLAYMNPFIPWYPVQWNERVDDNAFMVIDLSWLPFRGFETYGELLLDDFQYENEGNRPDKIGFTAGMSGWLARAEIGAVVEYTRIDRYVYAQRRKCNYYLHHDDIIGSGLGPDADRITLSVAESATWPLLAEVRVHHTRHGEGTVQEGWPDSASTGGKFPSGVVEHTTGAALNLSWYPLEMLDILGSLQQSWVRNAEHVSGAEDSRFSASLEIFCNW